MREPELRSAVRARVLREQAGGEGCRLIEELGLGHGRVFVDVAVLNGELHGYELKSERDTLERLPRQAEFYGAVLDRATLVASERHLLHAERMLPPWWGLCLAHQEEGSIRLEPVRLAQRNPEQRMLAMTELLWREEALALLEQAGHARGLRGKSRRHLYQRLTEVLPPELLHDAVLHQLKVRERWPGGGGRQ
jgi:hypothetical protein